MSTIAQKMSVEEFLELPEEVHGDLRELVQGEIVVSPRPTHVHMHTAFALARILADHVERQDLGIVYFEVQAVLGEWEVRVPDILYFQKGRFDGGKRKRVDVVPDLCIEVLSPSNARVDRVDKFELYEAKGVTHYWLVDPEGHTIESYSLEGGRYVPSGRGGDAQTVKLPPFLELEIALARLWHP